MKTLRYLILGLALSMSTVWAANLATVNGQKITDKEVKAALSNFPDGQKDSMWKDMGVRKQIIDTLIDQEVLVQTAEKSKLDQDAEYKEALAMFRRQYLVSKALEKEVAPQLSEKAVKKYYEQNKLNYSTEQVRAQHILLADEATAKDVLKKAKEKDADFQALAEKHSKDPSAKNNRGELGFFPHGRMAPAFEQAAFAASKDQIVGPVKTAFGYHIIKVIEKKPGQPMEYAEIEMQVKGDLKQQLIKNYAEKLRAQAKIEVDHKAIEALNKTP